MCMLIFFSLKKIGFKKYSAYVNGGMSLRLCVPEEISQSSASKIVKHVSLFSIIHMQRIYSYFPSQLEIG